jgi:hypothetical protein
MEYHPEVRHSASLLQQKRKVSNNSNISNSNRQQNVKRAAVTVLSLFINASV